ncbi:MAG: hypothetical protein ACM34K_04345 [Bacillota bacterium]
MQSSDFMYFSGNIVSKLLFSLLVFILCLPRPAAAQINITYLTLNAGIIKNQQQDIGGANQFAFYPEIGIGGPFYNYYLEWRLNFGFWDDGIRDPLNVMDMPTYSHNSIILGGKIIFLPQNAMEHFPLPVHLMLGFSYHYLGEKYIGGEGVDGKHRPPHDYKVPALDLGAGINVKASKSLRFRLETDAYIPVIKSNKFPLGGSSSSLTLGVDLTI